MLDQLITRYWAKVQVGSVEECWLWQGARTGGGYGQISSGLHRRGRAVLVLATHVALAIDRRPRPTGEHVAMHRCDNPRCVNPAHLSWGLPTENMRDMWIKGRSGHQQRIARDMDARALELVPGNRKLSDDDVRAIRSSSETTSNLARQFGVSWTLIDNVRQRKARTAVHDLVGTV